MVFYEINRHRFANPYAAFLYAAYNDFHTFPTFNFYNEQFESVNWTVEPQESFQSLCDRRAHQLREKYEKIVLPFSGGTDGMTIYNTFIRNNIHIDEIYVTDAHPGLPYDQKDRVFAWITQHHPDPTTKITLKTMYANHAVDRAASRYNSQYYQIDSEINSPFRIHVSMFDRSLVDDFASNTNSYCIIAGFEKPYIMFENNHYYFYNLDKVFANAMMQPEVEFFFTTPDLPELHAKQCHMIIRACECYNVNLADMYHLDNFYLKSAACGRDNDIFLGSSPFEKKNAEKFASGFNSINFAQPPKDEYIYSQLAGNTLARTMLYSIEQQGQVWHKYKDSWASLQTDRRLLDYMVQHRILEDHSHPIQGYYSIFSKKHLLK
jgi:hypothetical protein